MVVKFFCRIFVAAVLFSNVAQPQVLQAQETRLLRNPAISERHVAFIYAGDLWVADRDGGNTRRLTTAPGEETTPCFSPDGATLAFSGQYDGNTDVFTVPVGGGEPKRLTWHPGPDLARTWTPDGKAVVFASGRDNAPYPAPNQFWKVGLRGGMPEKLPIPRVWQGQYAPDGNRFVYQMVLPWEAEFRNYRGGQNNPIRIIDLKSHEEEKLPFDGANDNHPVWVGDRIYFLSDRDFAMNIWMYDVKTKKLSQQTQFRTFDCKGLSACSNALVFENGGQLWVLETNGTKQAQKLPIAVQGDFPWARPHWEKAGPAQDFALSASGKRAVFSARGDIFTVPADKGNVRNLTNSPGTADRAPAWSPDGKRIAWFSDATGEYELVLADQNGKIERSIALEKPTFYYTPRWSPDSRYLSYADADRRLWALEIATGKAILIDNEGFANPYRTIYPEWSPDSRWIAYTKRLSNEYNAIFVYSLDQKKTTQLTDGLSDSRDPAWDKNGRYLYFLASTDFGLNVGWLDMSSIERPLNRAVYCAVLKAGDKTPLVPESDEENPPKEQKDTLSAKNVRIDFDGILQRIVALDIPPRRYEQLVAGEEGILFFSETVLNQPGMSLHRYKSAERKSVKLLDGVEGFALSADGKKLLYGLGGKWGIGDAGAAELKPEPKLAIDDMRCFVDPQAEAKQMFKEAWRYQRDYFYVKNVHGLDLDRTYRNYAPWVDHVRHRSDLNYLLDILGGETSIGHSFTGGGDYPDVESVPVGLLGADYEIADGRFRFAKIYNGENWNPTLKAPLTMPGVNIKKGDYLLAVNGISLDAGTELYRLFDQTAGKQVRLTVSERPGGEGAREEIVTPIPSEAGLRQFDWVENNRRKVEALSEGKLAYVWVPNTGEGGYAFFNRYYFAQKQKKGAVIDERFNQGGYIADYIIDLLDRPLYGYFNSPVGDRQPFTAPDAALFGPKVMIINEMAGSGGDMLPYMFRFRKIGPLIGKKTWGGLVGIWDVPPLLDGGYITAPRGGFYNADGQWDVENIGVAPDIEVDMNAKLVNAGRDPQLEKAVETALQMLREQEVKLKQQPADPVRVRRPGGQ